MGNRLSAEENFAGMFAHCFMGSKGRPGLWLIRGPDRYQAALLQHPSRSESLFASEIKALLQDPDQVSCPSMKMLSFHYLSFYLDAGPGDLVCRNP